MGAPFKVARSPYGPGWLLSMRNPNRGVGVFSTPGDAIDYAYKNWPWYL